jgi:3-hydroxy-5-phosphonooxypentane-2,4-dione thiolase
VRPCRTDRGYGARGAVDVELHGLAEGREGAVPLPRAGASVSCRASPAASGRSTTCGSSPASASSAISRLDWGMKNRLARVFNPASGRTVMLAVDHGYFQGPTTGLERIDLNIVPLMPHCDALFCTRGILRTTIPPAHASRMVLRASGGPEHPLKELSNEEIAMDMEDALRLNASGVGIQVFIGGEFETRSVHNMTRLVDQGLRYGMPVMAVTAVGKDMARDARYFRLACRICAELGAHYVKTYYVPEDFETVTASCPVPIVMAGGKKMPELGRPDHGLPPCSKGAAGVDMGRNIFQSDAPAAMRALRPRRRRGGRGGPGAPRLL